MFRALVIVIITSRSTIATAGPREEADRDRQACLARKVPLMLVSYTDSVSQYVSLSGIPTNALRDCKKNDIPYKKCPDYTAAAPSKSTLRQYSAAMKEVEDYYWKAPEYAKTKCLKQYTRGRSCTGSLKASIDALHELIYVGGGYDDWIRDLDEIADLAPVCGAFGACIFHGYLESDREDKQKAQDDACRAAYDSRIARIADDEQRAARERARQEERRQREEESRANAEQQRRASEAQRRENAEREASRKQDALERARALQKQITGQTPNPTTQAIEQWGDYMAKRNQREAEEADAENERRYQQELRRIEAEEREAEREEERAVERAIEEERQRIENEEYLRRLAIERAEVEQLARAHLRLVIPDGVPIVVSTKFERERCERTCDLELLAATAKIELDDPHYLEFSKILPMQPGQHAVEVIEPVPMPAGAKIGGATCAGKKAAIWLDGEPDGTDIPRHPANSLLRPLSAGSHYVTYRSTYCLEKTVAFEVDKPGTPLEGQPEVTGGDMSLTFLGSVRYHRGPAGPQSSELGVIGLVREYGADRSEDAWRGRLGEETAFKALFLEGGPLSRERPGGSAWSAVAGILVQARLPLKYGVAKLGASAGVRVDFGGETGDGTDDEWRFELAPLVLGIEATPVAWLGLGVEVRQFVYPEGKVTTGLVVHIRFD